VQKPVTTSKEAAIDRYREYSSAPDLLSHVACTWVRVVRSQADGERNPIIPDGCVDVVTYGDAPPHVAGPATETQWLELPRASVITGIRFRPGAARDILHCSLEELRNAEADLVAVCDRRGTVLNRYLDAAAESADKRLALEHWTRGQLQESGRRDAAVVAAARRLTLERSTIDDLAEHLDWNVRRVHRQFVSTCGYGPKMLQRVLRLQRTIRVAHASLTKPASLPQLAAVAGYADQAHMTREFRALTGFTPAEYLSAADPNVGRWLEATEESFEA
jgi:AraC-like DNA-binding protein